MVAKECVNLILNSNFTFLLPFFSEVKGFMNRAHLGGNVGRFNSYAPKVHCVHMYALSHCSHEISHKPC